MIGKGVQGTSPAGVQGERCLGDSVKGPLAFPSFPKGWGGYALMGAKKIKPERYLFGEGIQPKGTK